MRVERISDWMNLEHVIVIGERRGDVFERGHKKQKLNKINASDIKKT